MTRRTVIGNLIAEQLAAANSAAAEAARPAQRVAAGPVRTMGLTLDKLELERKSLEQALAGGSAVVDIHPALVDASFAADRFAAPDGDAAFAALKQSIAEFGQEVPILVRPSPGGLGRYQAAYGHRRLRACAELGRKVRAVVRDLSDAELVVAQGVENAQRVDLSFIEKAAFARGLEDRGFDRPTIMAALGTDKTELSKLIATVRSLPETIVLAIGPAPKAGRRRWMQLAELLASDAARRRVERLAADQTFLARASDDRFVAALAAAERAPEAAVPGPARRMIVRDAEGAAIAEVTEGGTARRISIDRTAHAGFAEFVVDELPELFRRYQESTAVSRRR